MGCTRRGFLAGTGAALLAGPLHAAPDLLVLQGPAFGAGWQITVPAGADTGAIAASVTAIVASVDAAMSPFNPASEVARFNRSDSTDWQALSPETLATVQVALAVAQQSGGAFDPTVGGLVGRYGFGPITRLSGGSHADIALHEGALRKMRPDLTLDLCGIAKGHALGRIVAALEALGLTDFFVELGGEVQARGLHPGGRRWRAGVERPDATGSAVLRVVELAGEALATSGDRVNGYSHGGRRYGHIIDPATRAPAQSALASVSVFSASATMADAMATALFAMGPERGAAFAGAANIAALFVLRNGAAFREITTAGFSARIIG
ncbi:MAG: FAD:protein FMN transferase [Rhodobacteraceae bacterium]|nr:FAD:protein FMN transferase [Paracoccaceae bacterium]